MMKINQVSDKQIAIFFGSVCVLLASILILMLSNRGDYDCRDFKTQEEAQKVFETKETDVYFLDSDKNGVACNLYFKNLTPTPTTNQRLTPTNKPFDLPVSQQAATAGQLDKTNPPTTQPTQQPASTPKPGGIKINLPLPTIKLPDVVGDIF